MRDGKKKHENNNKKSSSIRGKEKRKDLFYQVSKKQENTNTRLRFCLLPSTPYPTINSVVHKKKTGIDEWETPHDFDAKETNTNAYSTHTCVWTHMQTVWFAVL